MLARMRLLVPAACGVAAAALAGLAVAAAAHPHGGDLSALVRMSAQPPLGPDARARDPSFRELQRNSYDGQFYWAIGADPLAVGSVHPHLDDPPYRYGHPLYSWLALLASGGRVQALPEGLVAVGLLSMLVAGVAAALLAVAVGRSPWWGLAAALNPGLLIAAMNDLAEPLAAALLLLGLLAYVHRRWGAAIAAFALGSLAKEPLLLVGPALAAWELWRRRASPLRALLLAASPVPALAWWVWLRVHLGAWPFAHGAGGLGVPLRGWRQALVENGRKLYDLGPDTYQMADAHVGLLLVLAGLLAVLGLRALRLRGPAEAAFLPLALLLACVTRAVTTYPKDLLRTAALALLLAPFFAPSPALRDAPEREPEGEPQGVEPADDRHEPVVQGERAGRDVVDA
jgi:hypothetical protein